jgi:hypothetical protein
MIFKAWYNLSLHCLYIGIPNIYISEIFLLSTLIGCSILSNNSVIEECFYFIFS